MQSVGIILVVLVIVGLTVWIRRRNGDREISSIDSYRDTLTTLQSIQRDRPTSTFRVLVDDDGVPAPAVVERPRIDPAAELGLRRSGADGESVFVFDDARPVDRSALALDPSQAREAEWAINHMGGRAHAHHPRQGRKGFDRSRWSAPVLVGAALVAIGVGLALIYGAQGSSKTPSTTTTVAPTTTVPPTTTTSSPAVFAPTVQGAGTASYAIPTATYTIVVTATGAPTWTQTTNGAGKTVDAGLVAAGANRSIALAGKATLSIGAASTTSVTVNAVPVTLPTTLGSPTLLTFVPAKS